MSGETLIGFREEHASPDDTSLSPDDTSLSDHRLKRIRETALVPQETDVQSVAIKRDRPRLSVGKKIHQILFGRA